MNNKLANKIYGKREVEKIGKKIDMLGTNNKMTLEKFINIRLYISLLLFMIPIIIHFINDNIFERWYVYSFIFFIFSYIFIKIILIDLKIKKRERKLEEEAYYYFEILTLTLQTGRNLENSIKIACNYIDNEISNEFKQMLFHMKLGKSLSESLDSMRRRIPSKDINNIILNIKEASISGTNIVKEMQNQLEYLNKKQLFRIKEEINKIPNKISIISVLFIVPLLFLIILSPLVIKLFV